MISLDLILSALREQKWWEILSNPDVIAAFFGIIVAFIAGRYLLKEKQNEYINDYYKTIIQRRIVAYEHLENVIVLLKTSIIDDEGQPYHSLFSSDEDFESVYQPLMFVMTQSLWLSDKAFKKFQELNFLIFGLKPGNSGIIEFGKQNYKSIAIIRSDLEKILAIDMLRLYDVKTFLKQKRKNTNGFHQVHLKN